MEADYQLMKNVGRYGCLTKKNSQLKLSTVARNTLKFVEVGHVTFYHKLKNCLRLTSVSKLFSSHRDSDFRCRFYLFNNEI